MNLAQALCQAFKKYPDKPAIIFEGRTYRFQEINEEVRKRALWLKKAGVRKGDRVALKLPKGMEFIFFHLAAMSVGAITLPLNPGYSNEETTYFLTDSKSSLFITETRGFEPLHKTLEGVEGLKTLLIDGEPPEGWGPISWELKDLGTEDPRTFPAWDDDVAMICYTAGTTGKSKGAMITHRNLVANMLALKKAWDWTEGDVLLHVLPLFHIHGLAVALHGGLHAGSTIIMHEKFDPQRTWKTLEKEKCTLLMGVPTIYHRLAKEWETTKPDLGSMRLFISGSAPLAEDLFRRFAAATGFRILERYGMTEAGMITSNPLDPQRRKPKSVGYPLPGVQIRLVSRKGTDVEPGEVGEVWIRGDSIFKGYWEMPEKTEECFVGGWLKSGDLGYQDPEDSLRLYLVGRAKEVIITGGYNVYPKEVENVLEQHEAIQEAAAIGLPDDDFGERVMAVVVIKKGHDPIASDSIIAFCKKHLASYKCPKEIFAVEQLPRNALGKIQKGVLQKFFALPDFQRKRAIPPLSTTPPATLKKVPLPPPSG